MTVRLRLTLLCTGILALMLLAFGVVLYVTVEGTTSRVSQDGLKDVGSTFTVTHLAASSPRAPHGARHF